MDGASLHFVAIGVLCGTNKSEIASEAASLPASSNGIATEDYGWGACSATVLFLYRPIEGRSQSADLPLLQPS
jgi:hypothetical protein